MKKKIVSLLAVVLMTGVAYGTPGDVWSLSGDMQTVSNPSPAIDPGVVGGGTGTWDYKFFEAAAVPVLYLDAVIGGPLHVELPAAGDGWTRDNASHLALVKFSTAADLTGATGGDKTNYVIGDVGGHTGVVATWTSSAGGFFSIDYLGYNGRNQATAAGNEQGRQTVLSLTAAGLPKGAQIITGGIHDGSATAFHGDTVIVQLAPGETIELKHEGIEWAGMDITITEVVEQPVCDNPPGADVDDNCWVDLIDLMQLGTDWLQCGIVNKPEFCFQ